MELMHTILSIICLMFGFYYGYRLGKDKEIPEIPKGVKHPIKARKEHFKERKEEERQNEILQELQQDLAILDQYDAGIGK